MIEGKKTPSSHNNKDSTPFPLVALGVAHIFTVTLLQNME